MNTRIIILIGAVYFALLMALAQTYNELKPYVDLIVFITNVTISILGIWEFIIKKK